VESKSLQSGSDEQKAPLITTRHFDEKIEVEVWDFFNIAPKDLQAFMDSLSEFRKNWL
jgi:hypothetical protein